MEKVRRCDSRCHNAKGSRCKCWCGGRYHGLGNEAADKLFKEDRDGKLDEGLHVYPGCTMDLDGQLTIPYTEQRVFTPY